ncbi:hypothetical protein PIB30_044271 [Stylosanthes scabra]|uniref:Uncharacterized protein n=1 Tax=Stylosanthes scabra TaxID=79078 RepID=A0ABU6RFW6_9FABA|nr:hypothetical protein [Stylosanthes scabra]
MCPSDHELVLPQISCVGTSSPRCAHVSTHTKVIRVASRCEGASGLGGCLYDDIESIDVTLRM